MCKNAGEKKSYTASRNDDFFVSNLFVSKRNLYITNIFRLLVLISPGNSFKLESFNSSGVYFKYMGPVKIQIGTHFIVNPINITVFELVAKKYEKKALDLKDRCDALGLDCLEEYFETEKKLKLLDERMDRIYELVGDRRKTRFLSRQRRGFCMFCKTNDHSGSIQDIRATINSNFYNVQNALTNQNNMIETLNNQNKEINSTIQIHQSQINEAVSKINELINVTRILEDDIQKSEVVIQFNKLNSELSEVQIAAAELQKIIEDITLRNLLSPPVMKAADLLSTMSQHPQNDHFLYTPTLPNYPKIMKSLKTLAFLDDKRQGIINVMVGLPLFSLKEISLYEPLTLPIISNKKVVFIDNKYKYCAITENMEEYNCGKDLDAVLQSNGEFYLTDQIEFPLYNSMKKDQCLINIFRETSIDKCKFKYLHENIEIFHNLGENRYIFAVRDKTKYFLECGESNNYGRNDVINGTGLLELDKDCVFETDDKDSVCKADYDGSSIYRDKYKFELDDIVLEKLGNLTLPKDFIASNDKDILLKLSELDEKGIYFVPEMHWLIKFLHSKVFHSIVTITITLLIIGGLVFCFLHYPRYAKVRTNIMLRVQKYRIRSRVLLPPEEEKLKVTKIVEFYEECGKEKPLELIHVKKSNNMKNKKSKKVTS